LALEEQAEQVAGLLGPMVKLLYTLDYLLLVEEVAVVAQGLVLLE
jgi:hypothetical protein